jgi:hypothetical protein|tara:strand:+ start:8210 stop:8560 length:351 start_codon:yes stop_codon:yes gene_type:complete
MRADKRMPIKEAEELWPTGPEVLLTLEEAVQMAEEMSAPPAERWVARTISDKLIPSLYEARTYIEVGQLKSPEIRLGISRAALEAGGLADVDSRYAPLYSKIRVLAEEAAIASRTI